MKKLMCFSGDVISSEVISEIIAYSLFSKEINHTCIVFFLEFGENIITPENEIYSTRKSFKAICNDIII